MGKRTGNTYHRYTEYKLRRRKGEKESDTQMKTYGMVDDKQINKQTNMRKAKQRSRQGRGWKGNTRNG